MKTTPENTDTFLADWLDGKISDDQLKQRVSESDFIAYKQLRNSLQNLEVARPDMERNFEAVREKRDRKSNKKTKVLPLLKYAMIAASIALIFGLYQLFVFSNSISTNFGETFAVALNDHSTVTLNAKSTVCFPTLFKYNRTIKLDGEAYFQVQKGSTFTVKTSTGEVQVLGTKFNVASRPDFFEVICFEGKVKVTKNRKSIFLIRGEAIRFDACQSETWKENDIHEPDWISGESSFRNAPLYYVVAQLERQYNYKVALPSALNQSRFTGSFTHKNLDTALQSICIPMNLKYSRTTEGKILISE